MIGDNRGLSDIVAGDMQGQKMGGGGQGRAKQWPTMSFDLVATTTRSEWPNHPSANKEENVLFLCYFYK